MSKKNTQGGDAKHLESIKPTEHAGCHPVEFFVVQLGLDLVFSHSVFDRAESQHFTHLVDVVQGTGVKSQVHWSVYLFLPRGR